MGELRGKFPKGLDVCSFGAAGQHKGPHVAAKFAETVEAKNRAPATATGSSMVDLWHVVVQKLLIGCSGGVRMGRWRCGAAGAAQRL